MVRFMSDSFQMCLYLDFESHNFANNKIHRSAEHQQGLISAFVVSLLRKYNISSFYKPSKGLLYLEASILSQTILCLFIILPILYR